MKIADLLAAGRTYSFEFFPPRTDEAERALEKALTELEPLRPSFVSVTYGAGGTTRERTHDIVHHIHNNTSMLPMAHLSCIAHRRDELVEIIDHYRDDGIENILALAGDPPPDFADAPADLRYASELAQLIRERGDFSVGVAAHPEVHPRSPDRATDRKRLAEKLACADFAITQFFFEIGPYLSLVEDLAALGVTKPILPGVMPVTNVKQIQRFAELSGATFTTHLAERLYAVAEDPEAVGRVGVELATELCQDLLDAGAPGLHFYTMNRSTATREVYANLGLGGA